MKADRPTCPYCAEHWSDSMLAEYDRFADHTSCSCSTHAGQHVHGDGQEDKALPIPTQDLCCESCGKPIYRAPVLVG